MPKITIPKLGDYIQLTKDWSFTLYEEHRNYSLIKALPHLIWCDDPDYPPNQYRHHPQIAPGTTLLKDTILRFDRIYMRNGLSSYDSMTFRIHWSPTKELFSKARGGTGGLVRFWVKLDDALNIEYDPIRI